MSSFDTAHAQVEGEHQPLTPEEERRRQRRRQRAGAANPLAGPVPTDQLPRRTLGQALSAGIGHVVGNDPVAHVDRHTPEERDVLDSRGMASELRRVLDGRLRRVLLRERSFGADQATRTEVSRLQSQILALTGVANDAAGQRTVTEIATDQRIRVDPRHIRTGAHEITTNTTTMSAGDASASRARETTTVDSDGSRNVRTQSLSATISGENGLSVTRARSERADPAIGGNRSSSVSTTGNVNFSEGNTTIGGEQTRTNSATAPDGSASQTAVRNNARVEIGEHRATASWGQRTTQTETEANGNRSIHQSSLNGSAGIINGPDEHGFTVGLNGARSTEHQVARANDDVRSEDERETHSSSSTSGGGTAQLTDHGAGATGNITRTDRRGPMTFTSTARGNASFRVDVEPADGDAYDVVTTLSYGGSAGGTVRGGSENNSLSVGASANASRVVTFRHRMTQAEVQQYMTHARAASEGASSSNHPEFTMFNRLRAAGANQNVLRHGDLLNDPTTAAQLDPGSSFEVADTVGATGTVSGSVGSGMVGAGASVSGGGRQERAVRVRGVEIDHRRLVEIRLTYADAATARASGSVRMLGVSGEAGTSHENTNGRTVIVQLDPQSREYQAQFATVMGARDLAAAERLSQDRTLNAAMTRSWNSSTTNNAGAGIAGENGVGTGITGTSTQSQGATMANGIDDQGRRTFDATTTGASAQTGNLQVLGTTVASTSDATTATNHVDTHGRQTVDVNREQHDSVPVLPAAMQEALHTTWRQLDSMRFSEHDLLELTSRAGNAGAWLNALTGTLLLHIRSQWNALGAALRNPVPNPAWHVADPALAVRIARGQAITSFVASVGSGQATDAFECIRHGAANDVGRHMEWPSSIAGREAQFTEIERSVDGAHDRYANIRGDGRADQIHRDAAGLRTRLFSLLAVVQSCDTFSSGARKVETVGAIQEVISRLARIERHAVATPAREENAPIEQADVDHEDDAVTPQDREADLRATIHDCVARLQSYKDAERSAWQAAQGQIRAAGGWFANPNDCANSAIGQLESAAATYQPWVRKLHEAFAAIQEAHGDQGALDHLRPNVNWTIQLLREATAVAGSIRGFIESTNPTRIEQWRRFAQIE